MVNVLKKSIKSLKSLNILIRLYHLDEDKEGTISDFERFLGCKRTPTSIRPVLLALIDSYALYKTGKFGTNKYDIYRLDKERLFEAMKEIETFQDVYYTIWENISVTEGIYEKKEFKEIENRIKSYL